jgi:hypothetical protein
MKNPFSRETCRRCGLTGALLMVATTAAAQELPNFDVEAYCTKLATEYGFNGGKFSPSMFGACKSNEQNLYDVLTGKGDIAKILGLQWDKFPAAVREHCLSSVFSTSYQGIMGCLAAVKKGTEPFRR